MMLTSSTWSRGQRKGSLPCEPGNTPPCGNHTRSRPHHSCGMMRVRPRAEATAIASRICRSWKFTSLKWLFVEARVPEKPCPPCWMSAGGTCGSYQSRPPGGSQCSGSVSRHSMNSRMRWRLPSVPQNWKVACTAKGLTPCASCIRCTKKVCPDPKRETGRTPAATLPLYPLHSRVCGSLWVEPLRTMSLKAFWSHRLGSFSIALLHCTASAVTSGVALKYMMPMLKGPPAWGNFSSPSSPCGVVLARWSLDVRTSAPGCLLMNSVGSRM
mmetsp:Transcript_40617/g.129556  ORF Transcript_40617/g.129556 Transcript_40617/m.129556 type:complete len:270 (-) Transcript_40617:811-1620(-)